MNVKCNSRGSSIVIVIVITIPIVVNNSTTDGSTMVKMATSVAVLQK